MGGIKQTLVKTGGLLNVSIPTVLNGKVGEFPIQDILWGRETPGVNNNVKMLVKIWAFNWYCLFLEEGNVWIYLYFG